ncbi:hypothetical protein D3C71_1298580 [compost metagenome]
MASEGEHPHAEEGAPHQGGKQRVDVAHRQEQRHPLGGGRERHIDHQRLEHEAPPHGEVAEHQKRQVGQEEEHPYGQAADVGEQQGYARYAAGDHAGALEQIEADRDEHDPEDHAVDVVLEGVGQPSAHSRRLHGHFTFHMTP